jgi:hypothetical protein
VEGVIFLGIFFTAIIGIGAALFVRRILDIAFRVDLRGRPSFGAALATHLPLGMGMFYVDPRAPRKWVYLLVATLLPIVLTVGPFIYKDVFDTTQKIRGNNFLSFGLEGSYSMYLYRASGESNSEGNWNMAFAAVGGIYLLSLVDVLATCYSRQNLPGARKVLATRNASEMSTERRTAQPRGREKGVIAGQIKELITALRQSPELRKRLRAVLVISGVIGVIVGGVIGEGFDFIGFFSGLGLACFLAAALLSLTLEKNLQDQGSAASSAEIVPSRSGTGVVAEHIDELGRTRLGLSAWLRKRLPVIVFILGLIVFFWGTFTYDSFFTGLGIVCFLVATVLALSPRKNVEKPGSEAPKADIDPPNSGQVNPGSKP